MNPRAPAYAAYSAALDHVDDAIIHAVTDHYETAATLANDADAYAAHKHRFDLILQVLYLVRRDLDMLEDALQDIGEASEVRQ